LTSVGDQLYDHRLLAFSPNRGLTYKESPINPLFLWIVGSLELPTFEKTDIVIIRFTRDLTEGGLVFIYEI